MKKLTMIFAGAVLCAGLMAGSMVAFADEAEVKSTFLIQEAEVANTTDLVVKEGTIEKVKEGEEEVANVTLTDETGIAHSFPKVDVDDWKDLKFVEEYEMYYLQYTDKTGKSREAEEAVDEIIWEQPVTMYAKGSVNVRKEPVNGAEAIHYAELGEEHQVIGVAPGWFKIQLQGDEIGYIYHKYLTTDKELIDQLVAEAEAQAALEASYDDYDYSAPSGGKSSKKSSSKKSSGKKSGGKKQCLDDGLLN